MFNDLQLLILQPGGRQSFNASFHCFKSNTFCSQVGVTFRQLKVCLLACGG